MTPTPRRVRQLLSWTAATAVWCSVLAAAVVVGLDTSLRTITPATAAAVGSVGAACAGSLMWHAAWRIQSGRRVTYQLMAAGIQTTAAGFAAACWLPEPAATAVAGCGFSASVILWALALLRLPDSGWAPQAVQRRLVDGAFVGLCALFGLWLLVARFLFQEFRGGHLGDGDLAIVIPGMMGVVMLGVGFTTSFRLQRWRRRHAFAYIAVFAVHFTGLSTFVSWQWDRPADRVLWWSVAWIATCVALLGVTYLARNQKPAPIDKPNYPGVHYTVMAGAAAFATSAVLIHGASEGPLPLDATLLGLAAAATLGARLILTYLDVRRVATEADSRQRRLNAIVGVASDTVLVLDPDLTVTWHPEDSAWRPATDAGDLLGASFLELVHIDDRRGAKEDLRSLLDGLGHAGQVSLNVRIRDASRRWRHTETVVSDLRGRPQVRGLVARIEDVGARRSLETELARLAYTDPLTGLANRRALLQSLEDGVAAEEHQTALLLLDLDGFKNVNDTRGHDFGDELLVEVSRRIKELLRPTDVGARLGGDEFAILLRANWSEAVGTAKVLVERLAEPYEFHDYSTVFVTGSVGIATAAEGLDDPEILLRNADLALRAAKQAGKNRYATYDADFDRKVRRRNELTQELRGAIDRDELRLVYQPVFCVSDRTIVGAEALLRWNHPRLGHVSPGEFIPAATESGLTQDLAVWTVNRAAEQLAQWHSASIKAWISVNVSVKELHTHLFATEVNTALIAAGVPAKRLVLEVTEHDFSHQMNTLIAQLGALRGAGVRIALDDFGSGYSSLGQLDRLPVDILKIDRDLIAKDDGGVGPLAAVTVELGRLLGMEVIAEGVETDAQLNAMIAARAPLVQGYLLAKPMDPDDLTRWLTEEPRALASAPIVVPAAEAEPADTPEDVPESEKS
ncbi:putative bifunctional diguanylate cyclase/phosphodiesterase [Glycomyces harbinensis]|uniref:Diguanylate cyclase (GGDEF) domain-containing protein n=1 Tax=Glycomyces harbinensis TaxID=58114 RepID=A0A1G6U3A6_9ACTN|nr:EAL domain-containing protein [Glycomyces harbinensis]SDD35880.1 diguanylate cyclase (GGDEF) domain-containing protein [Glycomyces harbinensis]